MYIRTIISEHIQNGIIDGVSRTEQKIKDQFFIITTMIMETAMGLSNNGVPVWLAFF